MHPASSPDRTNLRLLFLIALLGFVLSGAGWCRYIRFVSAMASDAPRPRAAPSALDAAPLAFRTASVAASVTKDPSRGGYRLEPGGYFFATGVTLRQLIELAHQRHVFERREIEGGPDWMNEDRFDVKAVAPSEHVIDADGTPRQAAMMLRALMADRFRLRVRLENRDRPVYALVAAPGGAPGPRLRRSAIDCGAHMTALIRGERVAAPGCATASYPGRLVVSALPLPALGALLSGSVGRPVIDRTGLTGLFDAELEAVEIRPKGPFGPSYRPSQTTQSIFEALPEQLGLKLEAVTGGVEVVVVEHAERPDAR